MSKARIGFVAVVLLIAVLAGLWRMRGSNTGERASESQAVERASAPPLPQASVPVNEIDSEEEPPAQLPAIPPPTAEWLRVPARVASPRSVA